jgi:hypothetical protein
MVVAIAAFGGCGNACRTAVLAAAGGVMQNGRRRDPISNGI